MFGPQLIFIIVLFAAASLLTTLAIIVVRQRSVPASRPLASLLVVTAIYCFGYAFELSNQTLEGMLFWIRIEYLGISFIPVFWLLTAARYTSRDRWLTKPVVAALFLLSLLSLVLNWTNDAHQLFYRDLRVDETGTFPLIAFSGGLWYWVHQAYANLAILAGNILLLVFVRNSASAFRKRGLTILLGAVVPWLAYLAYLAGLSPHHIDLTPFGLAAAGPILAWGILRFHLLDIVPVAMENVFAGLLDGVVVIDFLDRVVDFNPSAARILPGLGPSSAGKSLGEAVQGFPELLDLLRPDGPGEAEVRVDGPEGLRTYLVRFSPIVGRRGRRLGRTLIFVETTEQVRMVERLRTLASIDDLTGVYNRRHFSELGNREVARARRYGHPLSVVILDLDHFKRVNDSWGHEAGDHALQATTDVLKNALRTSDIIGRHGGEEFSMLLPETPLDQAVAVAERLRSLIARTPIIVSTETSLTLTASFGVAGASRAPEETLDDILRAADRAMYEAKTAGRDCVRQAT